MNKIKEKTDEYKIEIKYPEFIIKGVNNFNEINIICAWIALKEAMSFRKENIKYPFSKMGHSYTKSSYMRIGDFQVTLLTNNLFSVRYSFMEYTGGAHSRHWTEVINGQIQPFLILSFNSIFKKNWIKKISDLCIDYLLNAGLDENWVRDGASPKAKNFRNYNFSSKHFIITFNEYQVGPFVAGEQKVYIPYQQLKSIIKMSGPLGIYVE